jgi:Zincin-like metallopeptidase
LICFGRVGFGDDGYAMEELVAELGSAFLGADLQIRPEIREDRAGYIHEWLKVLKGDKRAVFTAASHASKAVDFLHGLQPQPVAGSTCRVPAASPQSGLLLFTSSLHPTPSLSARSCQLTPQLLPPAPTDRPV